MIKKDLIEGVMREAGCSRAEATSAVEAVLDGISSGLEDGGRVELRGFGVFEVKLRKKRIGRNPMTGEVKEIPPGKSIRFKPGKELRELPTDGQRPPEDRDS